MINNKGKIISLFAYLFLLVSIVSAATFNTTNLIAYYDFESNASGNLTDTFSGLHNGSVLGNINVTTLGKHNNAYQFSPTTASYVKILDNNRLDINYYTISAWVYMPVNVTAGTFLSKGFMTGTNTAYLFRRMATGAYVWGSYDGTWRTMGYNSFTINKWYHAVLTHNSTGAYVYVNGTLVDSYIGSFTTPSTASNIAIGADLNDNVAGNYYNGFIDEMAIFNRSMPESEIVNMYSQELFYSATSSDTIYPTFTNYNANNNTGTGTALFNVTVSNTNGTVWLNFNGVNYPASNSSTDKTVFNVTLTSITPGTYNYAWYAKGNGTNNNQNNSVTTSFTELDLLSPALTINFPLNQSYGTTTINFSVNCIDTYGISSAWYSLNGGTNNYTLSQEQNEITEWTQLGQNSTNNGFYSGALNLSSLYNTWNYTTTAEMYGGPVIKNDIVYFATMLGEGSANGGSVFAINTTTHNMVWRYNGTNVGGNSEFAGTTYVENNAVWIGSDDFKMYKLNATNGSLICSYTTGNYVPSEVKIKNGIVYFGGYDNYEYALNETNCALMMSYNLGGSVESHTALSGDYIYTSTNSGKVFKLSATNFSHVWNFTTVGSAYSGVTVARGKVYVGTLATGSTLYILNDTDGTPIANFTAGGSINPQYPTVVKDAVYFQSYDNKIYKINATNATKIWEKSVTNYGGGPIIVTNDGQVIATTNWGVIILNDTDGSHLKNFTVGNYVYGSAMIRGNIYFTSLDKKLHVLAFNFTSSTSNTYSATNSSMSTGSHKVNFYCNDSNNNINNSENLSFFITGGGDTTKPYFTVIPSTTIINYSQGFNVKFTGDDETGFGSYAINWTSLFAINSTGGLYNTTTVQAGYYLINVTINDTSNNLNSTIFNLTVNQATPTITKLLNGVDSNLSITYPQQINATGSTNAGTLNIYFNGTTLTSGANYSLPAGLNRIDFNVTGNANYTNTSLSLFVNISKSMIQGSISGTTPIVYGTAGDVQGSESNTGDADVTYRLYRNGAIVSNPDTEVLGAGTYNYIYNATTGQNYTANSSIGTFTLIVNTSSSSTTLTISPVSPIVYPATSNFSCSGGGVKLYVNGVDDTTNNGLNTIRGVYSGYNVTCIIEASVNITGSSASGTYTITKGTLGGSLSSSAGWTISNGTSTTVSISESNTGDSDVNYTIYRDTVSKGTSETVTLPVGNYTYLLTGSSGVNWTANSNINTQILTVLPESYTLLQTTFNNISDGENLTFISENFTRYLKVPQNYRFTKGYMNLSGYLDYYDYCYQEFANQNTCNQTNNGVYWNNSHELFVNYSIPFSILNNTQLWKIKYLIDDGLGGGLNITNITIPTDCLTSNTLTFNITIQAGNGVGNAIFAYCKNITGNNWITIINVARSKTDLLDGGPGVSGWYDGNWNTLTVWKNYLSYFIDGVNNGLYEEAMIWNVTHNLTSPTLKIGNYDAWSYSGTFNQSNNRTSNLANQINSYLNTCTYYSGYCYVPFIFSSDSAGILRYSDSLFSNDGIIDNGITYTSSVYETSNQNYILNTTIGLTNPISVQAVLNYNGTNYTSSSACVNGNCMISNNLDIPLVNSNNENKSFYWVVTYYNSTSIIQGISSTYNQSIQQINLTNCSTPGTIALNFSAFNEGTTTQIDQFSFKAVFNYWIGSGNIYRTYSFNVNNTNSQPVCILNNNTYTNAYIQYGSPGYNDRDYYLTNFSLTNITQNIPLYLLWIYQDGGSGGTTVPESTSFIDEVLDNTRNPISDAYIYIQRCYASSTNCTTVQIIKTDVDGRSIGFYKTETVNYKHLIYKNGILIYEDSPHKIYATSVPYTNTFFVGTSTPLIFNNTPSNLIESLLFNNNTKIVTFTYTDTNLSFSQARLLVRMLNYSGNEQVICNSTSTQSSASISCDLSLLSEGNYESYAYITRISESQVDYLTFTLNNAKETMGKEGLFLGWIIILTFGMAFLYHPIAGIWGVTAAMILTNVIGFTSFTGVWIFGAIVLSIIFTWFFRE